jgi:uncharacterized caspase-like protein
MGTSESTKGERDVRLSPAPRRPDAGGGSNAVVAIGIDHYRSWPRLYNAVSDARGALELFVRLGFEAVVPPLVEERATADAMRQLVADDLAALGPSDSLVVFFAGHGHTRDHTFEDGTVVKTGYIMPVDADGPGGSTTEWLRLDSWLTDIAQLPPRHILVILDACHSGIALGSLVHWRDQVTSPTTSLMELSLRRSRRVITSALDDQVAMDGGPVAGHSLFTGCLIEGLRGGLATDGRDVATGTEIGLYVQRRVTTYPSSKQTPDFGALELDDRGELLVALGRPAETSAAAEPPSPVSPPRRPSLHPWLWRGGAGLLVAGALAVAISARRAQPPEPAVTEPRDEWAPDIDAGPAPDPDAGLPVSLWNMKKLGRRIESSLDELEKGVSASPIIDVDGHHVFDDMRLISVRTNLQSYSGYSMRGGSPACERCKKHPIYPALVAAIEGYDRRVRALEEEHLGCIFGYKMGSGEILRPAIEWGDEKWTAVRKKAVHGQARCWSIDDPSKYYR